MDRRDEPGARRVTAPGSSHELAAELVQAFTRLAEGDFSVRLPRNYQRDHADALAFFVNLIAEQLDRLLAAKERSRATLEAGVAALSERFLSFAAGDFTVRADRTGDQHDAYSIAAWLSRADRDGSLAAFLKPALTPPERTVARVEGWILGVA